MATNVRFSVEQIEEAKRESERLRVPLVEIHLKASQLGLLVDRLQDMGKVTWCLHLVMEREEGDFLDGYLVEALKQHGVDSIQTVIFLEEQRPEHTIRELHFLRECSTRYIRFEWTLKSEAPVAIESLIHLVPPAGTDGGGAHLVSFWQDNYSMEGLRYRRGPGMVLVRDQRDKGAGQIIQMVEQVDLDLFWVTREPKRMEELLSTVPAERIEMWIDMQLLIRVEDWVLSLITPTNRHVIPYI